MSSLYKTHELDTENSNEGHNFIAVKCEGGGECSALTIVCQLGQQLVATEEGDHTNCQQILERLEHVEPQPEYHEQAKYA